jgi:hypothetical protein
MVWFFERETETLICEIRKDAANTEYEFEIAGSNNPSSTRRFTSPTELINAYLQDQARLRAEGWKPRAADIAIAG